MNLNDYQEQAVATAIYNKKYTLVYPVLGLAGEAGEMANQYKKILRDDMGILSDEKRMKLAGELGDCLWYVAGVARDLGLSLEEVARMNLDKLAGRMERGTIAGSGEDR